MTFLGCAYNLWCFLAVLSLHTVVTKCCLPPAPATVQHTSFVSSCRRPNGLMRSTRQV